MKIYYSKCDLCNYYEQVSSLTEAQTTIEKHEEKNHKKKQVGSFGYKEVDNVNSNDA
jgi:hypothetical protein